MLAIRLQRTGRKGYAHYRVVVQDSRLAPTSGRVVAQLGHYNPHTKDLVLKKDKAEFYLNNGAQPSDRVVLLLKKEGIALPDWVSEPTEHKRTLRNPDKLRKNQPKEEAPAQEPTAPEQDEVSTEEPAAAVAADETKE